MTPPTFDPADASTLWVCVDCLFAAVNGEAPADCTCDHEDSDGPCGVHADQPRPWALWADERHITYGLLASAHECGRDDPCDGWCGCEHESFSWRSCDGCGSRLGGQRDAFTYWPPAEVSA